MQENGTGINGLGFTTTTLNHGFIISPKHLVNTGFIIAEIANGIPLIMILRFGSLQNSQF